MLAQQPVRTPVASVAASPVGRVQDTARWVVEVDHADVIAEKEAWSR
jgi:hypothetical protein